MQRLKLIALDSEDLGVISAHCQDAVVKVGDIGYLPAEHKVVLTMNRFVWGSEAHQKGTPERRQAVLHFSRVLGVQTAGIDRRKGDQILSLLAMTFTPNQAPSGTVELVFSGNAGMRLTVECIEAQLADMAAAWQARARPDHGV
jgi:hypothetical protein